MAHQLLRIKEKLSNTPHLMHLQSFETIIDYLESREVADFQLDSDEDKPNNQVTNRYSFNSDIGVAVMNIDGPLTYKPVTIMGMDCGGTSYQQLKEDFTYLADNGAKTIALSVSSGGGEAFQMMPTAQYMRKMADDKGINLLAYVDGMSCSAAYGLSCIADQVIMAPSAEVGSIGVVVRLINDSKALEMAGYERTFIAAGASKTPFDDDGSFKPDFLEDIQSKVDTLYTSFTEFVAEQRGISVEAVRATEAKTFLPETAIALGLADSVQTLEEFYSNLAELAQNAKGNDSSMLKDKLFKMTKNVDTDVSLESFDMNELELAKSELSALQLAFQTKEQEMQLALAGVVDLQAKLAEANEFVAQFKAEKEAAELAAKAVVVEARTAKLASVLGDDAAKTLLASLDGLSDAQMDAVVASHQLSNKALNESVLFSEVGADATIDTAVTPAMEDHLAKLIAEQYKTKTK